MAKKIQDGNQIVTNVDSNDNLTFSIKSSFIDSTPTANSTNLVTSGGVKSALDINTTDIAAAVIRIANNETNISNNTDDIEALEDAVSTNTTNISTNTTDIDTLETTVGTLSTNVNANTTKIGTLSNLTTTSKTNLVNAINELETDKLETSAVVNEASTDTDKTYSADYLNDKLVSVGATAPENGERVWFAHSKNVLQHSAYDRTLNGITLKVNDDKSITLTGTASANTNFNIGTNSTLTLKAGTYTFTKGATNVQLLIYYSSASVLANLPIGTSSKTITINSDTTYENYRVVISIPSGTQTNETVYPMLRLSTTSNTYEPYIAPSINVDNEDFISMSDLVSVGVNQPTDGRRVWFKKSKNLLPQNQYISSTTINGITFTNNGDGTFNLSGTATANTTIIIMPANIINLEANQPYYLYSSIPYDLNTFNLSIVMTDNSATKFITANNTYTPSTIPTNVRLQFYIGSGKSINKTNIKLMLVKGTTAPSQYEPYIKPSINVDEEEWYSKPKVLWANPNPTSIFAEQIITLNESITNYNYYEILYKTYKDENIGYNTGKIPTNWGTNIYGITNASDGGVRNRMRSVTINSPTQIAFTSCSLINTKGDAYTFPDNHRLIPYQILGYK